MDIFVGMFRGRALWLIELITTVLVLALMLLLVWGTWAHFARSFDWNAPMWSRDSTMDIALPIWPAKVLAPIAFAVLSLRLMLQVWAFGRALITGAERPVAVPLIEDAATQAAREAAQLSGRDE
jgi:TRAP-type C4-dicarboxylate transport system permease small subunit